MTDYDVVILGTGVAGLTAAIAAHDHGGRVGLFEKSDRVGGTSAWSGGLIWLPNNPHGRAAGKSDSREEALAYIRSLSHGLIDEDIGIAFVDGAADMIAHLESKSVVKFTALADFPDYYPELPGGKPEGGRTVECPPFAYGELGVWRDRVEVSPYYTEIHICVSETTLGQAVATPVDPALKQRRMDNDERGMGHALVGRLLKSCLDRGIEPQLQHAARLLKLEDGRIVGADIETPDGIVTVNASNVVIATGGFEWNEELRRAFLRGPMTHPVSVRTNTGDGLKMAMRAGAMLGNMREAWWAPVIELPEEVTKMGRQLMSALRGLPGAIMINREGRRFINEATNYNAVGAVFHEQDTAHSAYRNLPCWILFGQRFVDNYGFPGIIHADRKGGRETPEWVVSAPTIEGLAERLGIPSVQLAETVRRYDANAEAGADPDFKRGDSAHDRWWGDPAHKNGKQATLGPVGIGPYYAIEIKSGALGTKGGPRTNRNGNVIDLDGAPIPGLYAAGNAMASPFGMAYAGAGGTLAPAMVFGFLSGRHAADREHNSR